MTGLVPSVGAVLAMSWRQSRARTTVAVVLVVVQAVALPLAAARLGALTDAALAGDTAGAVGAGVALAVLVIASLTLGNFAHIAYFELIELNILELEQRFMALSAGSAGLERHDRAEHADDLEVLKQEVQRVGWSLQAILSGVALLVAMVITAVLLAALQPVLLALPLAAVPALVAGRRAESLVDAARERAARPARLARHLFGLSTQPASVKELRLYGLEHEMRERHASLWAEATAVLARAEIRSALLRTAGLIVFAAGYAAAAGIVVRDALRGAATLGDIVLAITLTAQIQQQVAQGVTLTQDLFRLAASMNRMRALEAEPADEAEPPTGAVPARVRSGIRLRGVGFRYPGSNRPVLSGIDCVLPAGGTVAVVGENGAGKSTLVKLLLRLYTPTEGTIDVDGVPLRDFPVDDWRAAVSAGFQDHARFSLPAREVVGLGSPDRATDDATVLAALDRAGTADVVDRLRDGLDTLLGTDHGDGQELSGGQWQKLAIGRALARQRPLLLVLDEPTSALDADTEHRLFERYAANAARLRADTGAITLLVSHRFSTVRMADLIIVLGDGGILETGDHDTLMRRGGQYAELYSLQATAYR